MSRVNRWIFVTLAAVWFVALAPSAVVAQSVIRGPYLQMGTPTSVVVRWRTDVATDSRVSYGSAPDSLTAAVDDTTSKTEHEVTLSLLSPDTVYYYAVGTTTGILAGNDASHFFLTAPNPGTPKPTRIWVLGDSGTADAGAAAVRDAYVSFTGSRETDLWLMLGDNAYSDGTDAQYQAAVFNMYPTLLRKSVLWPTLGNHDGHSADSATQSGPYYDIFTLPRNGEAGGVASGTEAYYSFDYGNIHFIVLDSFDSDRSPGGAMMTWLETDLAATKQDWIIAFWHHPPYSKGSHDSDTETELIQMRQNALPILEQGGVDLVLAGHSHSYERSFLIDGHYGTSNTLVPSMILDSGDGRPTGSGAYQKSTEGPAPHQGAVYTVAGSSGHTSSGSLNHPVMFISLSVLGSLVLDVEGNRLDATFLDSGGGIRDTFTILKGGTTNTPPVAKGQSVTTNPDTPVAITLVATDADGDTLTYTVASPPANGSLSGTAPNLTYTPNPGFSGTDSFSFTAKDSQSTSNLATVSITVALAPIAIATEGFESGTFSGGSGWSGPWTVSGDVSIRTNRDGPQEGTSHVRLRQKTGHLQRQVDLSGARNVHLTFWAKVKSFESSDTALVKVSPDGVTFTTVKVFTRADSNNTYRYYDIDLASFTMTANFSIAFDAEMSSTGDYWFIDNIRIKGMK